ncbi:MAG: VOC family protein [Pseudomonadales bacterium]|nr:VOC family protein [Pseudomonadales bacterium]
MKFKYAILYVRNVAETLAFYEKAFGFSRAMLHESGDYGELDTGNTALAFSSVALMTSLGKTPGVPDVKAPVFEIAFETDNVQSALDAAINAGATLVQSVKDEPWGQTTAYVTDMNDYLVEICSPVRA